ncbi:MAG: hypothetical protein O7H41_10875 [Planctomycetota bacterium]|nr:hypothetical protein [Planctomycetota bacterium]
MKYIHEDPSENVQPLPPNWLYMRRFIETDRRIALAWWSASKKRFELSQDSGDTLSWLFDPEEG